MAIKWAPDLGAPVAVTAVDLVVKSVQPTWQEWVDYIMAAGGYIGAAMGWGGDFVKNVGISSLPLAGEKLYDRIKGMTTTPAASYASVNRMKKVAGKVAQTTSPEFENKRVY